MIDLKYTNMPVVMDVATDDDGNCKSVRAKIPVLVSAEWDCQNCGHQVSQHAMVGVLLKQGICPHCMCHITA